MRHTPGPWDRHDASSAEVPHIAIYKANIPGDEGYEVERIADAYTEANAELIVAAPETKKQRDELLTALDSILHHAYDEDTPVEDIKADFDRMRDMAAKAIASARKKRA